MDILSSAPPTRRERTKRVLLQITQGSIVLTMGLVALLAMLQLTVESVDLYKGPVDNTAPRPGIESVEEGQKFPDAGFEESPTPLGTPPVVAASKEWAALEDREDGSPLTWDACRPIHYVLNPTDSPVGSQELLTEAVADVSAATGLTFIYDGTTDESYDFERDAFQPKRYGNRWSPVLISWSVKNQTEDGKEMLGHAGPRAYGIDDDYFYVTGSIEFKSDPLAKDMATESGQGDVLGTMRHELGHLVGLDHVKNPSELMNPEIANTEDFAAGDRAGLAALGAGGCDPRL